MYCFFLITLKMYITDADIKEQINRLQKSMAILTQIYVRYWLNKTYCRRFLIIVWM